MDYNQFVKNELTGVLDGSQAHRTFQSAVRDFPMEFINTKPPNFVFTFWHQLEHILRSMKDLIDYIKDPNYQTYDDYDDYNYWPSRDAEATEQQWNQTIKETLDLYEETYAMLKEPDMDIFATVPVSKGKHTNLREILLIIDHNAFHVGQFATLRRVAGIPAKDYAFG
ncbi:MAG: DinB family protein [Candidatus Kariarchaeaceae archaeon]|jgi:uncharacterized damage-inducible protein DinB